VGVWVDKDFDRESHEFYLRLVETGVDFFCSDYPDKVLAVLRNHYSLESVPLELEESGRHRFLSASSL